MGRFLGEVKPIYGRWHWPFKEMKDGDYFIIDKMLRSSEDVRHYATVRAAQLSIPISVWANDDEHPGYTRVTRREMVEAEKPDCAMMKDFELTCQKLNEWYGFDANRLPYGMIYPARQERVEAAQRKEPPVKRIIFHAGERDHSVGIVFDRHGFTVHGLPRHATPESWIVEPSIDEVMS